MSESFNKEWETIFRGNNRSSIKKLEQCFVNENLDVKDNVVDFLLTSAQNDFIPFAIVLITIHILRRYSQTTPDAINLSKRASMNWWQDYSVRYTLANCLNKVGSRECHLEALKQKIIGCSLEIYNAKKKKNASFEDLQLIKSQHFGRLDNIRPFLEGDKKDSSECGVRLGHARQEADDDTLKNLRKLEPIGDILNLPQPLVRTSEIVCILDTNAISNRDVSKHLTNKNIHYKIPAEILLELADWYQLQQIPWELDGVEICDVINEFPPEIDYMFAESKGRSPSIADKKVVALAWEAKACAIISDDRDLWDSGVSDEIEKNSGHRIHIIRPRYFNDWLEKHNLCDGG